MSTIELPTIELSTDCTCEYIDDETGEFVSGDCYGCYNDTAAEICACLAEVFGEGSDLIVSTDAAWWNRVSGWASADPSSVVDLLALRGEFRLVFDFATYAAKDSDTAQSLVSVMRYSHDEPTGASFTIGKAL